MDTLRELYHKDHNTSDKKAFVSQVLKCSFMFVLGVIIFPLGIALGFHHLDKHKKFAIAALSGAFITIVSLTFYVVTNWESIQKAFRAVHF